MEKKNVRDRDRDVELMKKKNMPTIATRSRHQLFEKVDDNFLDDEGISKRVSRSEAAEPALELGRATR